jgi:hypothetical protein
VVIVPAPPPTYTLSPHLAPLGPGQQAVLDACLDALTGRLTGVVVTAAGTTPTHHVIQLATNAGPLLVTEGVDSRQAPDA